MNFTGKNLEIVREALGLAVDEIHNQIATCPDVVEYATELEDLRQKQHKIQLLFKRVSK